MARLVIIPNNNSNFIGDAVSIPDSAIPAIRLKYGGATNAETANNLLAHLVMIVRSEIREHVVQLDRNTHTAAQVAAEPVVRADYNTNTWPVP